MFYKIGMVPNIPDPEMTVFESSLQTGVEDHEILIPGNISISAFPNPFNSSVNIGVSVNENGVLAIYDLLGQQIHTFQINQTNNTVVWDGRDSSGNECVSGIYFIKFSSERSNISRSVTLLK